MMHPSFYHWHNRAELKPEPTILQARWDAAAKFAAELSGDDACSLLRLALFGTVAPEFAKRLSDDLVTLEPTFPPEGNAELLRVMATAALYSGMETESLEADAIALGLLVAGFQPDRIQPVCKELAHRATEYLATESERMRPTPKGEADYGVLEKATEAADWAAKPEAAKLVGNAVLELGKTMGRIAEENQFLWWLLGRRSSLLNTRREKLLPKEYALIAGAEAAERVALVPHPASVESLIGEVLTHCSKPSNSAIPLVDLIDAANFHHLNAPPARAGVHQLCPLKGLLEVRRAGGKLDDASLEKLKLPAKLKIPPAQAAIQYFRELMFFRALAQLG
jgi:hypothetical protein